MAKIANSNLIRLFLTNWMETRKLTLDWIDLIPSRFMNKKLPRIGLNTFAKQILEMSDVQDAYVKVLDGGDLDFSKVTDGTDIRKTVTKEELKERFASSDSLFKEITSKVRNWDESIRIFGRKLPKYSVLELMTRHETLHHGQLIAYGFWLGIGFPKSWVKTWALPTKNNRKHV